MMEYPLSLKSILERNRILFPDKEVFSRTFSKDNRYNYGEYNRRVCRLANALERLGIKKGDKVGTFAWNNHRHLEIYFGVPCSGIIMHTINLRLPREHLIYVINHAEDKLIFVDEDLVPLLESVKDELKTVKQYVIMTDADSLPETKLSPALSYEELLAESSPEYNFPDLDEWTPATMCYTTATTGNPKGVVYTHRGLFLHSMAACMADTLALSERDVIMPVVPMFHVNAWSVPFAAVWMGSKLVLPGRKLDPKSLCELMEQEKVTVTAGVPTIWAGVNLLLESGASYNLKSLRAMVSGGAPISPALIENLSKHGIPVLHAYGMTETTPLVLANVLKTNLDHLSDSEKFELAGKQGLIVPGLEMKVVRENGESINWDGKEMGELLVRGPWIAKEYYKEPEKTKEAFVDGWLHTGDIVTVDQDGYVFIMDRTKDLVKSGGEWISSVDLENRILKHPAVAEAAVIAIPHEKWQERPLACVVLKEQEKGKVGKEDILEFLSDKVPKWWMPDEVLFLEEIPKTSVGKISKKKLREMYREGVLSR